MPKLLNEKREYQRLLHSEEEQTQLKSKGFEAVFSSNVSAIATQRNDLLIRFHGGATYSYRNKAKDYDRLMGAASKGKWVWRFLIRPSVPYSRTTSVIIKDDVPSRDMMETPREPKFKVEAVVPSEFDIMTKGLLPSIKITPITQLIKSQFNTGGILNTLSTMASIDSIIGLGLVI